MAKRVRGVCSIEGCDSSHRALGYCNAHHRRFKLYGDPLGSPPPKLEPSKPERLCEVDGCGKPVKAQGWCAMHYKRARNTGGDPLVNVPERTWKNPRVHVPKPKVPCSELGCDQPSHARGLCTRHYKRTLKYGSADGRAEPRPLRLCSLGDCGGRYYAKGYCVKHYYHWKRWGDPNMAEFWVTGEYRLNEDGYMKRILRRDGVRRYELEHRVVMAEVLGRELLPSEEVHHKNTIRHDNRPENLELWKESTRKRGARMEDLIEYVADFHLAAAIRRAVTAGRGEEVLAVLMESWQPEQELVDAGR